MAEIAAFLEERLAEDEELARTAEAIDALRRFAGLGADPCLPYLNPDTPKPLEREIVDHENVIRLWLAPYIGVVLDALADGDQEDT